MFRAARLPSSLTAGRSSSVSVLTFIRTYAISIQSPRVWPGKAEPRVFSERKTYLYNHFTSLLSRGSSQPLLFLHHKNFKASRMVKLRREVAAAALPKGTGFSLLDVPPDPDTLPQLTVIRSSLFGVALRNQAPLDEKATAEIAKMAGGEGLAILCLSSLDPPTLQSVLRALDRAVPKKLTNDSESGAKKNGKGKADAGDEGRVPGRRMKRLKPMLDPELVLVGALIEGQVFGVEQVKHVSKLPTLETLRQQIVGLISSPAVQLTMVLGEASGGKLARTLEGLKRGLEEDQPAEAEEPNAP